MRCSTKIVVRLQCIFSVLSILLKREISISGSRHLCEICCRNRFCMVYVPSASLCMSVYRKLKNFVIHCPPFSGYNVAGLQPNDPPELCRSLTWMQKYSCDTAAAVWPHLKESKCLQDRPVPVIHFASHCLLDVRQSNAQQGKRLMRIQPVRVEELTKSLTLTCLQHQTTGSAQSKEANTG